MRVLTKFTAVALALSLVIGCGAMSFAASKPANICKVRSAVCYTKSNKVVVTYDVLKAPAKNQKVYLHIAAPVSLIQKDVNNKKGTKKTATIRLSKNETKTISKAKYKWCDGFTRVGGKDSKWSTVKISCKNS